MALQVLLYSVSPCLLTKEVVLTILLCRFLSIFNEIKNCVIKIYFFEGVSLCSSILISLYHTWLEAVLHCRWFDTSIDLCPLIPYPGL